LIALGKTPTGQIVTILHEDGWQALVIEDLEVLWQPGDFFDTIEAALKNLLEYLSIFLYQRLKEKEQVE
jgi:hypothetical protein